MEKEKAIHQPEEIVKACSWPLSILDSQEICHILILIKKLTPNLGPESMNSIFSKTWINPDLQASFRLSCTVRYKHIKYPVYFKAMASPVVMFGCESWTIKKGECRRIDAFELWCWRRLQSPLDSRRSTQSVIKEINPEYSLEGLMLKLKLQYFGQLMWRVNLLEKTLMLGKIEDKMRRGWQRKRWLDSITNSVDMNLSKVWEIVKDREAWHATVHEVTKSRTRLSNWTITTTKIWGERDEIQLRFT